MQARQVSWRYKRNTKKLIRYSAENFSTICNDTVQNTVTSDNHLVLANVIPSENHKMNSACCVDALLCLCRLVVWSKSTNKKKHETYNPLPPSSSASVSDSSLSTSLLSWVPTNSLVQIINAVSAPPTVSSTESLCSHRTLVTWALWPTYFLNLACWPCNTSNWHESQYGAMARGLDFHWEDTGSKLCSVMKPTLVTLSEML